MFLWRMDAEKSCPNCRAAMKLESKTPGFLSFECPKCAFVLIEVAKEDAPPTSSVVTAGTYTTSTASRRTATPTRSCAASVAKHSIQNSEGKGRSRAKWNKP